VRAAARRYQPAIIAQAAAMLRQLYAHRFWFGMGSGEALNQSITADGRPKYLGAIGRTATHASWRCAPWDTRALLLLQCTSHSAMLQRFGAKRCVPELERSTRRLGTLGVKREIDEIGKVVSIVSVVVGLMISAADYFANAKLQAVQDSIEKLKVANLDMDVSKKRYDVSARVTTSGRFCRPGKTVEAS
jgi:hypothetical protein